MTDDGPRSRRGDYRGARIGAAAAVFGVLVVIIVIDALSPDYEAALAVLGLLSATGLTLLGIEVRKIASGNGGDDG